MARLTWGLPALTQTPQLPQWSAIQFEHLLATLEVVAVAMDHLVAQVAVLESLALLLVVLAPAVLAGIE